MNRMVGVKFALGNWAVVGIYVTLTSVLRYYFARNREQEKYTIFSTKTLFFRHLLAICLNFKNL